MLRFSKYLLNKKIISEEENIRFIVLLPIIVYIDVCCHNAVSMCKIKIVFNLKRVSLNQLRNINLYRRGKTRQCCHSCNENDGQKRNCKSLAPAFWLVSIPLPGFLMQICCETWWSCGVGSEAKSTAENKNCAILLDTHQS